MLKMSEVSKETLGLPPIALAEHTTPGSAGVAAQRVSTLRKLCCKCFVMLSSKRCTIVACIGLAIIGLILLWRFYPRNENISDVQKTQILIVTGTRQPSNETMPATDMTIFLEIKDKTNNSTIIRNRRSSKRAVKEKLTSSPRKKTIRKFDVAKAREVIINHNETCDPQNINEFCKKILQKLNVSTIDENVDVKQEVRTFRDADKEETLVTSDVSDSKLTSPRSRTLHGQFHDRSMNGIESSDQTPYITNMEIETLRNPYLHQHQIPMGLSGYPPYPSDCLLTRLLNQYNTATTSNLYGSQINPYYLPIHSHYGPSGYPYTSPGIINPYMQNGPHGSSVWPSSTREASSTGSEQSRHPQDVDISINYKDSLPSPPAESHPTVRLVGCPAGTAACASDDRCVEDKRWCDGQVDCSDGSDEADCSCRERVDASRLCDGYYDCPFGEDEMGCFGCGELEFSCDDFDSNSKSSCFEREQRCDNVVHCRNHKDEVECNMLAPSLHEKPIFAVSHTEGYLHRNYKGKWYPVCENPYVWAHDACRRETGLLLRPPFIQMMHVDPLFRGDYINYVHGDLFQMSNNCANSSAIYVTCQDLLCGTRVQTTTQTLRETADFENRLYGRNKRSVDSTRISLAHNKATIETEPPQPSPQPKSHAINREFKDISETIPSPPPDENNSALEMWKYLTKIKLKTDSRRRGNRTKRGFASGLDGRGKRAESRVVGGRPSQPAAWPWMVAIYKDGVFHCGGVIVSNRWVLSAAHCVHVFWEHYYEVQVGMLRRFSFSPQEQNHKVTHVIVNQRYSRTDMRNDLSLLRVAPALQYSRWVRPVCLPAQHTAGPEWLWGPPPGTKCMAVGWGATVEHGPDPDHMREVEVPVWNRCKHREDRAGREICAGLIEGGRDACQGDSGGPLLCKNPLNSRQWYMAGIVSHGDGCGRKGEPGVYTRVSMYIDWIHFHIVSVRLPTIKPKQDCPGFRCVSGISKCLPKKRMCDKVVDCLNAEDEIQCDLLGTAAADERDTTSSSSTMQTLNETQLQSTKTGETTPLSGVKKIPGNNFQTTPEYKHQLNYKINSQNESEKTIHETKVETQQHAFSNFIEDTEDLLSHHTNIDYRTTTERVIKPKDTNFRFPDFTTEANFIPEEGFEMESSVKKFAHKVSSALSDSINKKPIHSEVNNWEKESLSKDFVSSPDDVNQNDLEESTTVKSVQESTTTSNIIINLTDKKIIQVTDKSNHLSDANMVISNKSSDISENNNHSLMEDDVLFDNKDESFSNLNNDFLENNTDQTKSEQIADKEIETHAIDEIVIPEKPNNSVDDSESNFNNNSSENSQTELPAKIQDKGFEKNINSTESPQSSDKATEVSIIEEKKIFFDNNPSIPQLVNNSKGFSNNISEKGDKEYTFNGQISLTKALAMKKNTMLPIFECKRMPQIIRTDLRCNHQADCEDGTDEIGCTCVDYLTTFNSDLLCDGVLDCADGMDEVGCYECGPDQFLCKWSKTCLPNKYVCDGKAHCLEGEDELDCYALTEGEYVMYDIDGRPHVNLQGYLTKRQNNNWNVVCEENMEKIHQEKAANHICHYLGFSGHIALKTKYVNIPYEEELRAANETKSKRSIKSEKIKFIYKLRDASSGEDERKQGDLQDPVILPIRCVPNVIRTCMILYVTCVPTLNSDLPSHKLMLAQSSESHATKSANDILKRTHEYLWPWAANVYVEGEYKCTGVLVELSWVLVSDSCLWDILISKDYVSVVLGNKRTLAATSGPFEQILEVDSKKDLSESHVTLLHLRQQANFTRMVKPMVPASFNLHGTGSEVCVAVGRGSGGRSVTVLLQEVDGSCGRRHMCFERREPAPSCLQQSYTGEPWAGIISCRVGGDGEGGGEGGGGWFPAASFREARGECGFRGRVAAESLAHLRANIKDIIASGAPQAAAAASAVGLASCGGVRCARGACVPLAHACDGVRHCEDGADESEAACEHKNAFCTREPLDSGCRCSSDQLKCHSGRCISKDLFANGRNDCGDGSDEPRLATCAQYLARVAPHRLCDGRLHCQDRSDEDPAYCKCFSLNTERCHKSDSCVAQDLVCDGVLDCPHGEDEATCTAQTAPDGTAYGTGEVIVRQFGVWHTKCYRTPNHTRSQLENICRELGFISGHAQLVKSTVLPSINLNNNIELDKFTEVSLNRHTSIFLRSNDKPMARSVVDKTLEDCYPVYIECL